MIVSKDSLQQSINQVSKLYAQVQKAQGMYAVEDLGVLAESNDISLKEIDFSPKDIPILAMYHHQLIIVYNTTDKKLTDRNSQLAHHIRALYGDVQEILFEQIETWVYG